MRRETKIQVHRYIPAKLGYKPQAFIIQTMMSVHIKKPLQPNQFSGMMIDNKLSWKSHKSVCLLYKIKDFLHQPLH